MSRNRRRADNPVSLFPFLAVLVCTMGSLSLLLLVTTHRIRLEAVARADAELHAHETPSESKAPALFPEPAEISPARPLTVPPPEAAPAPEPRVIDLHAELERAVSEKLRQREARRGALSLEAARLESARKEVTQLAAQLASSEDELERLRAEQSRQKNQVQTIETERAAVSGRISEMEQRLRLLRERRTNATTKYAFVPYDGSSGTIRRPILIECTGKGIRILQEDILLTADDLDGFTTGFNPLLAGTRSLIDFWAKRGKEPSEPEPYVLLVVRPSGSISYYAARKLLSDLHYPSGYELLGENDPLQVPAPDPQATAACREAIDRTLAERENYLRSLFAARGQAGRNDVMRFKRGRLGLEIEGDPDIPQATGGGAGERDDSAANGRLLANNPNGVGASGAGENGTGGNGVGKGPGASGAGPGARDDREADAGASAAGGRTDRARDEARMSAGEAGAPSGERRARSADRQGAGQPGAAPSKLSAEEEPEQREFPTFGSAPQFPRQFGSSETSGAGRRWGLANPRASIGFERKVVVYTDADQIVVGGEKPLAVGRGESRDQLVQGVMAVVEAEVRSWGHPPEKFYWVPALHFVVSPGGNQHYERLHGAVALWGLSSSVEYSLRPYNPTPEAE